MTDFSAVRLIMVDLDGTLLTRDKQVGGRTRRALQACRDRGVLLAFNTGRPYTLAAQCIDTLRPDAAVMCYGAEIMVGDSMVSRRFLSPESATEILVRSREADKIRYGTADGGMYMDPPDEDGSNPLDRSQRITESINHICVWGLPEAQAIAMPDACGCTLTQLIDSRWCSFGPPDTGKGPGAMHLLRALNLTPEQMISFGDESCDVAMFDRSLAGIAMGNADAVTLAAADFIAGNNEEDGIGEFLERYLLPALPDPAK